VASFCYNGPRVPLGCCPVLQYIPCCNVVIYSKGRVLKNYEILLSNLSVVGFRCQSCCSSKSVSLFWNTRALVTAVQWSLVVNDLSITLSGKWALGGRLVASLMLILRLIFSN